MDESCQGTVPEAIISFLEGKDFERVEFDELKEKYGSEYQMVVPDESLTVAYRRIK